MERVDKKVKKERKFPRVPIKTYKWEDVRRSRRRGGYPWTHLYKEPFYDIFDPEPYTMEGMRNAKSSSTMGKSDMDISEVSTFDNQSSYMVEEIEIPNIEVKDPQNHSIKTSCSSLILDEDQCDDSDTKETDEVQDADVAKEDKDHLSPGMFFLHHSEESLDNISQLLDKEEHAAPERPNNRKTEETLEAHSSNRKRKLSADSKISLGKQAILQKLKDTKDKIKMPKITFPIKQKKPIKKQKNSPPPQTKNPTHKTHTSPIEPVYIHIPLKPPPGETDEFSSLEFETESDKKPVKKPGSFKDLVKNLKQLQEPKIDHKLPSPIMEVKEEEVFEGETTKETVQIDEKTEDIQVAITKELTKEIVEQDQPKEVLDLDKQETEKESDTESMEIVEIPNNDTINEEISKIVDVKREEDVAHIETETDNSDTAPPNNDFFDKLFEASTSRPRVDSQNLGRKTRSKSAEPERKRKLSLESSYSRKSLSKLGLMKRLRDAKDKIKNTFSRATSKKDLKSNEPEKVKPVEVKSKELKPHKVEKPVYIHIPLKPPEGTTDEFSHLENETTKPVLQRSETVSTTEETPEELPGNVQFIFLTAPSDDEILDYNSSDVPETPSSEHKRFFATKVNELKELAKGAVDVVTTGSTKLTPVSEESGSTKNSIEDITKHLIEEEGKTEKKIETSCVEEIIRKVVEEEKKLGEQKTVHMTVDEEDGLSESKKAVIESEEAQEKIKEGEKTDAQSEEILEETAKEPLVETKEVKENIPMDTDEVLDLEEAEVEPDEPKEQLKSVLKAPNSPVMKKKVSFKRKSKSKSDSYEEIAVPETEIVKTEDAKTGELDQFPSIPVDEEDTYMEEKMVKDISLEERKNRWSKISDHEYEPVNPPPDNVVFVPTLRNSPVCIIDTAQALSPPEPLNFSPTKTSFENISISASKEKSPKTQRVVFSATTDSRSSGSEPKPKEGPSKFQLALREKADNFKTKLQNIKKPHISLPDRPKFQKPNLQRFKIERKFSLPKMPDTSKINMPKFSLPKMPTKKPVKRMSSTESNAGDSKKPIFDFGTYPRIFKKKPKASDGAVSDFATVPRGKKPDSRTTEDSRDSRVSGTDSIRIPLHSEDSIYTEDDNVQKKQPIFDFGTYPKIFKKKTKASDGAATDFATVPRGKKPDSRTTEDSRSSRVSGTDSIRIPLHSEDSMDREDYNLQNRELPSDSSDIRQPSHRYDEDIDSENEYDRENRELMEERDFLSRWQRGRFNPDEFVEPKPVTRITDLDSPEDKGYDFPPSNGKEQRYSSGSSLGVHRQGVLEEINPDEFFLRQKGISQDNIEVGMYLSTEIREAFRNPTNALVQMEENNNYDVKGSHTSLPEIINKKKPIKKPKRKKTPHASQEQIPYDEETADEEMNTFPPSRPKRRSRRRKKTNEEFIPYQETIPVDSTDERIAQHRESIDIFADDEREIAQHRESIDIFADDEREIMYENEIMEGKDHPEIKITDPYRNYGDDEDFDIEEEEEMEEVYIPEAPPRKQKSMKSLSNYENDSNRLGSKMQQVFFERRVTEPNIISYTNDSVVPERKSFHMNATEPQYRNIQQIEPDEYRQNIEHLEQIEPEEHIEPIEEVLERYKYMDEDLEDVIPMAPVRKNKSVKSLNISENESLQGSLGANRAVFSSEKDLEVPIEPIRTESKVIIPIATDPLPPKRPSRSRSRGDSRATSQSRTAPQSLNTSQRDLDSLSLQTGLTAEDDIEPCVEEPCVQKICDYMGYSVIDKSKIKDPPLPPPRSLRRKKRSTKVDKENKFFTVPRSKPPKEDEVLPVRPLRNYSTLGPSRLSVTPDLVENKENIDITQYIEIEDEPNRDLQSGEVIEKMKTRPLPAPPRPPRKTKPFQDITSSVTSRENIMSQSTEELHKEQPSEIEVYTQTEPLPDDFVCEEMVEEATDRVIIPTQATDAITVERRLITPTSYTFEETVTHGSLLVEPLNGARILPDSDISERPKERIVPIRVEDDFDETSSIPDDFHKLADPKPAKQSSSAPPGEIEVLKAQKLQVTDLDVDTLTVNKLLAGKIVVSEIDSGNIQTNEISSKTGALKVGEISLPPEMIQQIIQTIQSSQASEEKPQVDQDGQKKTPFDFCPDVETSSAQLPVPECLEKEKIADLASSATEPAAETEFSVAETKDTVSVETVETERIEDDIASEVPAEFAELKSDIAEALLKNIILNEAKPSVPEVFPENSDISIEVLPKEETIPSEESILSLGILSNEDISVPVEEEKDSPPVVPPRAVSQDAKPSTPNDPLQEPETVPHRPPRQSERLKLSQSTNEESVQEPEVDDEPPPRPPQPPMGYLPSQPPTSFYALRAQKYVDDNIPTVPRRRRHAKSKQLARSSSEESSEVSHVVRRHPRRASDPSIAQLSGQLARACGSEANNQLKRLINYILNNVLHNEDGKQDLNVMIIIILVLIAGLLLLGYGDERTVVHLHHWEYFNPPKNL
ncbi:titin isoform X3 [Diabrotica virgifera virgifera]|uniref:Titin-like isoform X3 n=1 Tax=Diabrotica virgifera virgifera TaxID=50390 RepID=A0A6P7F0M6_DIAVI|nr:titin isoform X3 [Diabrotica virgifera virgifera]